MAEVVYNYTLANTAGYKFDIVKIGQNTYDQLSYYQKENFPDVKISRANTSLDLLHTKSLMSVNGFIYPTEYDGSNLFIPNATLNMLKSRANHIGIYSFNNLSDPLVKFPITSPMITTESSFSLYEKALITFPRPIGKFILVIAGYLVFEHPEYLYRVSPTTFVLRLDKLMFIEKLYELQRYRDIFTELNLPVDTTNPSLIDISLARSNDTIISFLTLNNSFLVELPVTNLLVDKIYLERSNIPGNFRTEIEPTLPIIVGYGKFGEYFKKKTNEYKYTVYLEDGYYNNYLISNLTYNDIKVYNDNRIVGNTYKLSRGYFLKVSSLI